MKDHKDVWVEAGLRAGARPGEREQHVVLSVSIRGRGWGTDVGWEAAGSSAGC